MATQMFEPTAAFQGPEIECLMAQWTIFEIEFDGESS
jgi:hypothetical protein